MNLIENFISYKDILSKLKTNEYAGLLLKFGADTCPPCRALDRGPLEELNNMVNSRISHLNKKLLIVNCNLSKDHLIELIAESHITPPTSIPAFFLFKYDITKPNLLDLKYESLGYNMADSKNWLEQMANNIIKNII